MRFKTATFLSGPIFTLFIIFIKMH